jgi:hypothetical protein
MDRISIGQGEFVSDDLVNGVAVIARTEASDPLAHLASRINAEHEAAEACVSQGVAHAVRAGQYLLDAKKLVEKLLGPKRWQKWAKENLKVSPRTRRLYMQMAGMPEAERQRVASLSLREAVKALTKKAKRGRWLAPGNGSLPPPELRLGDCGEVLKDIAPESVDLILTDIPWDKESIRLAGDLARLADRVLKPGRPLLVYCGNYAIMEVGDLIKALPPVCPLHFLLHADWSTCADARPRLHCRLATHFAFRETATPTA